MNLYKKIGSNHNYYAKGGDGGGVPHLPMPNRVAKPASADGTAKAGE